MASDAWWSVLGHALFRDRFDAGRQLADVVKDAVTGEAVVVGLARGGVQVASEIARASRAPLDALATRKVRHPWHHEYALGAVTPGNGVYLRADDGLTEEQIGRAVAAAKHAAAALDRRLHARHPAARLRGRTVILVDDGLATGATMIAAARFAHGAGAARVVAAVPVAAAESAKAIRREVDELVALHELRFLGAVGIWYETFAQVDDDEVLRLLDEQAAGPISALRPSRPAARRQ